MRSLLGLPGGKLQPSQKSWVKSERVRPIGKATGQRDRRNPGKILASMPDQLS